MQVFVHGECEHHAQYIEWRCLHLVGWQHTERVAIEQRSTARGVLVLRDEHRRCVDNHRDTVVQTRVAQQSAHGESLSQVGCYGDTRVKVVHLTLGSTIRRVGLQHNRRIVYRDDKFHIYTDMFAQSY